MGIASPPVNERLISADVVSDDWPSTPNPSPRERADRILREEYPPIERPSASSARRFATVVATVGVLALALLFPALGATDAFSDETIRSLSALLVLCHLVSVAAFAWWSHGQRLTIDALQSWQLRPLNMTWRWAFGWTAAPVVAIGIGIGVSLVTPNRLWLLGLGAALVAVRVVLLQALGTNMGRVVRGAKRWLRLWGVVAGIVDVVIVDIAITGVVDTRVEPGRLDDLVAWLLPLLVTNALFVFVYMKRVERWVLEFWDHRFGITEHEVRVVLQTIQHGSDGPNDYSGRRLIPTLPFRLAVCGSYVAIVGAALWNVINVWNSRGELPLASDLDAAVDRVGSSVLAFVVAICAVQVAQGLWSTVAAWNAKRCTIAAASFVGMPVLFMAGPAVLAYGMLATDERATQLAFVGISLLLNLVCWALSFSGIANTLDVLGRSSDLLGQWGATVSLHWIVIFMFRPIDRLDSDTASAGAVVVILLVDASLFVASTVVAWRAMRHFDEATTEYRQVRRISV